MSFSDRIRFMTAVPRSPSTSLRAGIAQPRVTSAYCMAVMISISFTLGWCVIVVLISLLNELLGHFLTAVIVLEKSSKDLQRKDYNLNRRQN